MNNHKKLEFEYTDSMVIFMNTEKYPASLESLLTKYGYTQSVNKSKNLHIWHKPHSKSLSYYEVSVPLNIKWNDFKDCLDSIAKVLSVSEDWSKQAILLDMKKAME